MGGGIEPSASLVLDDRHNGELLGIDHRHGERAKISEAAQLSQRPFQRTSLLEGGLQAFWAGEKRSHCRALLLRELLPGLKEPERENKPEITDGRKIFHRGIPQTGWSQGGPVEANGTA